MAHHPATHIGHSDKFVVFASIDLFLVLIERMDRTRSNLVEREINWRRIDPKWTVWHSREVGIGLSVRTEDHNVRQRRAVMVELSLLFNGRIGDTVSARK